MPPKKRANLSIKDSFIFKKSKKAKTTLSAIIRGNNNTVALVLAPRPKNKKKLTKYK